MTDNRQPTTEGQENEYIEIVMHVTEKLAYELIRDNKAYNTDRRITIGTDGDYAYPSRGTVAIIIREYFRGE